MQVILLLYVCYRRLCFQLLTIWWTRCTKPKPRKSSHIKSGHFGWRGRASSSSLLPVWHCSYPLTYSSKLWPRDIETVLYYSYSSTYSSKRISICLIFMDPYDDRSSNPDPWFPSKCWNGGFVILIPRSASCFSVNPCHRPFENKHYTTGIILGMGSSNKRRRYIVTSSLIDWAHTKNDPRIISQTSHPPHWKRPHKLKVPW